MSKERNSETRVGVFGTYGFGNMGDAALADGTIAGIERHIPNSKIIGICQQPENVRERHGIDAISMFRVFIKNSELVDDNDNHSEKDIANESSVKKTIIAKIKSIKLIYWPIKALLSLMAIIKLAFQECAFSLRIYKETKKLDLMVMSGSGQLNEEWGGPWHYPFSLFRWCLFARLSGCKVAFLSVGAGEVISPWTKFFLKTSLVCAHYVSVRDDKTQSLLKNWKIKTVKLVPDMAFSIQFEIEKKIKSNSGNPIVAINPISYCDPRTWHLADAEIYNDYIQEMGGICSWLLSNGFDCQFIPNDLVMDKLTIDDIQNSISKDIKNSGQIIRPTIDSYTDVFNAFSRSDYAICCRFHGLLFSFMLQKPVIAIGHHYKFHKLAEEMGQQKFSFNIDNFDTQSIISTFNELKSSENEVKTTISKQTEKYSSLVEDQFKEIGQLAIQS